VRRGRVLRDIERARECLAGRAESRGLQVCLPKDVRQLEVRGSPGAGRLEFWNGVLEPAGEKQREAEDLHDLVALDTAVWKLLFD
jgi:hypothetical protein